MAILADGQLLPAIKRKIQNARLTVGQSNLIAGN